MCLGGEQQDVTTLVGSEPFRAMPLEVGDWGVVELDETGTCKMFFQFVPREEHAVILSRQQLNIGAIGFSVFAMVGAAVFAIKGVEVFEALVRSVALTALIFAGAGVARMVMKQNGESQASLAFSIVLHVAITPSGKVVNAKRQGGTLASQSVTDCITLNVGLLEFPAKGGATVIYPFVFSVSG